MKALKADGWLAICVMIGAAAYLYADSRLPAMALGGPLGPKVFPALIGVGLVFSALLLLWENRQKRRAPAPGETRPSEPKVAEPSAVKRRHPMILVAMIAWTALYYACFEPVGYFLATIVFLLGLLSYFHRGHYLVNGAIAIGFTLVFDLLFSHFLNVPMPAGLLSI